MGADQLPQPGEPSPWKRFVWWYYRLIPWYKNPDGPNWYPWYGDAKNQFRSFIKWCALKITGSCVCDSRRWL